LQINIGSVLGIPQQEAILVVDTIENTSREGEKEGMKEGNSIPCTSEMEGSPADDAVPEGPRHKQFIVSTGGGSGKLDDSSDQAVVSTKSMPYLPAVLIGLIQRPGL
jgi:hypothetical protein